MNGNNTYDDINNSVRGCFRLNWVSSFISKRSYAFSVFSWCLPCFVSRCLIIVSLAWMFDAECQSAEIISSIKESLWRLFFLNWTQFQLWQQEVFYSYLVHSTKYLCVCPYSSRYVRLPIYFFVLVRGFRFILMRAILVLPMMTFRFRFCKIPLGFAEMFPVLD